MKITSNVITQVDNGFKNAVTKINEVRRDIDSKSQDIMREIGDLSSHIGNGFHPLNPAVSNAIIPLNFTARMVPGSTRSREYYTPIGTLRISTIILAKHRPYGSRRQGHSVQPQEKVHTVVFTPQRSRYFIYIQVSIPLSGFLPRCPRSTFGTLCDDKDVLIALGLVRPGQNCGCNAMLKCGHSTRCAMKSRIRSSPNPETIRTLLQQRRFRPNDVYIDTEGKIRTLLSVSPRVKFDKRKNITNGHVGASSVAVGQRVAAHL